MTKRVETICDWKDLPRKPGYTSMENVALVRKQNDKELGRIYSKEQMEFERFDPSNAFKDLT